MSVRNDMCIEEEVAILRGHIPDLMAASMPTKSEVFLLMGYKAKSLALAIENVTAALSTSEASRLSVEGERDGYRDALERIAASANSLVRLVCKDGRSKGYNEGLQCAFSLGAQAREALSLPVGAGGKGHRSAQDPGPHPCGSQLEPASMQGAPLTGDDWSDLEDEIADAIADSMDMDWTSRDGARAVVRMLAARPSPAPPLTGAGAE